MTQGARDATKIIHQRIVSCRPKFGVILGSGLSGFGDYVENKTVFSYQELPGFPLRQVEGHAGQLTVGTIGSVAVACMQGRAHFYEGAEAENILTYVRALKLLGCHTIIITGAVGSLRPEIQPGQIVLLSDHINFQGRNPLVGLNDESFGTRFPDMNEPYDKELRQKMEKIGHDLSIPLVEGVYISVLGPSFETPAEIRAFRVLGADVIGMSVVPEVIAARHCGLRVLGLAVVTNLAAGLASQPQSHEETVSVAEKSALQIVQLIKNFIVTTELRI